MSNLTTAQKTAIASGEPFRHSFEIGTPRASGSSTFDYQTVHDCSAGPICVTDPGRRETSVYNESMNVPGRLTSGMYVFTAANPDAAFSPNAATNWFYNSTGTYQAMPPECRVRHKLYVQASGSWSEITAIAYTGRILDVDYDTMAKTAEIKSECIVLASLRAKFDLEDDADNGDTTLDVPVA